MKKAKKCILYNTLPSIDAPPRGPAQTSPCMHTQATCMAATLDILRPLLEHAFLLSPKRLALLSLSLPLSL